MDKVIAKFMLFLLLTTTPSYCYDNNCIKIIKKTKIDPNIKSINGWNRVCRNGNIKYFLDNECHKYIKNICKCFKKELENSNRDRSIKIKDRK